MSQRTKLGLELAKGFHVGGRAVAEPTVELGDFLELLAAPAGNSEEARVDFGKSGHVSPQPFALQHREDILLAAAPARVASQAERS